MTNKYLFTRLDVNGYRAVRLVAILCWRSMMLVKTWLERVSKFFIGPPSVGFVSGVLVDLMFLRIFFMRLFTVATEGSR